MKNKILFLGSLCLVLALGLVLVGCDDGAQLVEYPSIDSPGNIEVVKVTGAGNTQYIVKWTAVTDADHYDVVFLQEGKNVYVTLAWWAGNSLKFSANGTSSQNDNLDNYSAIVDLSESYVGLKAGTKGKLGVLAYAQSFKNGSSAYSSDEYAVLK